jgi:hypothetical protein
MEYKIIKVYGCPETDNLDMELEDEVNMYIAEGWKPFGSPCVVNVGTKKSTHFGIAAVDTVEVWQTMIKETDNE